MNLDLSEFGYHSQADERLKAIVEFFWRGGRASASQLAARFDVTKRTINNDLSLLHFLERDGWTYYLPKPYIDMQPYEKAEMSGAMMMAMFDKAVPSLSPYSESLFTHKPKNKDIFLFDFAFEKIENEDILSTLVSIIDNRRGAEFIYTNNANEKKQRYTFPVKLANFNGYWYLLALDAEADRIKSFRINAIEELHTMQEDPISEDQKDKLYKQLKDTVSPWMRDDIKSVKLKVKGDAIRYFKRKSYDMIHIEEGDDKESIIVEVKYFNELEILTLVSKWIPNISIMNDDDLKEKMRQRLESAIQNL